MARCRHRTRYPTCQEVKKQKTGRKDLGSPRKRDKTRARVQRCRADPNKVKPNSVTELKNRVKPKSVTELKKKCETEQMTVTGLKHVADFRSAAGQKRVKYNPVPDHAEQEREKTRERVQRCRADGHEKSGLKSVTELKKKCAGKNRHRVEEGGPKADTELKKKREAKSMTKQMTVTGLPPGMGQSPRDR